ncbi:MAG: TetR family transcriptional regulator [Hyphomonas sp.]
MAPEKTTQKARSDSARASLLKAGRELFGRDGFISTAVNDISAAAGMSKSGLLHHFPSKAALFEAVFEEEEMRLVARVAAEAGAAPNARERMRQGARALLDALNDSVSRQIVLIDGPAVLGWAVWRRIEGEHGIALIEATLKEAQAEGSLARLPGSAFSRMFLSALHEGAFSIIEDETQRPAVEIMLDQMIEGLFDRG